MFFFLNGCASHSGFFSKSNSPKTRYFSDAELSEGLTIHNEMLSNFHLYTEPSITGYVNQVAMNLAGFPPDGKKPYEVFLLYDERIYAKSAPGGFIYLTTGMINFLENEAELAAIIAKEIGVLQFQEPELNENKKMLDDTARELAGLAPIFGLYGMLVTLVVVVAHTGLSRKIAPEDVDRLVSDELAMEYMVKAGYDPQGFIDVMLRFIQSEPAKRPYFHDYYEASPITEKRFLQMNEVFSELPLSNRMLYVYHDEFWAKTKGIRELYRVSS